MLGSFVRVVSFPPGWILFGIAFLLLNSTSSGSRSAAAYDGKMGEGGAISHVQNLRLGFKPEDTIKYRIDSVLGRSREAGLKEDIVGWSAYKLDDNRYLVFFSVREENNKWIGFEWFVNLRNGWVDPTNQYASWVMTDKRW
ncbi:MAG: hypothetical protein Q7O66_08315 [Dehalococcoidia bacterium]|nr:hypothetical protein [Dehalococcoidia bacterium]